MRVVSRLTLLVATLVWGTVMMLVVFLYLAPGAAEQQKRSDHLFEEVALRLDAIKTRGAKESKTIQSDIQELKEIIVNQKCEDCATATVASSVSNDQKRAAPGRPLATVGKSVVVLVIACNRPTVTKALDLLIKYRPSMDEFPIIVSQDCNHAPTAEAIQGYGDQLLHIKHPDQSDITGLSRKEVKLKGYYKISRHFKWALNQVFQEFGYDYAIVVEDDIEIATDFFQYMEASLPLMERDAMLWCISAWNDNGKEQMIDSSRNDLFYRTDFFPGLGWMLSQELWEELEPIWPLSYWDDWMRGPDVRKGRSCIRPEVSRTHTFGKVGVSKGQYYEQHLKHITLNTKPFNFTDVDFNYLLEDNYEEVFVKRVMALPQANLGQISSGRRQGGQELEREVRLTYSNMKDFIAIAKQMKIMHEPRGGVQRTAYKGIVSVMYNGRRVHLTPPQPWTGYASL